MTLGHIWYTPMHSNWTLFYFETNIACEKYFVTLMNIVLKMVMSKVQSN